MINDKELELYGQKITTIPYAVSSGDSYVNAMYALRDECEKSGQSHPSIEHQGKKLYRPLTIAETARACVENFNAESSTMEERISLMSTFFDTCSALVHKEHTSMYKFIPQCYGLILLDKDYMGDVAYCAYDDFDGIAIDVRKPGQKYGKVLTPGEVLRHEGWIVLMEEDQQLLCEYRDIVRVVNRYQGNTWSNMGIGLGEMEPGELCPLFIIGSSECAVTLGFMDQETHFLRGAV